jgi:geranylgeranyl reductase family protein
VAITDGEDVWDVVVVGAGPAGSSAALAAVRAGARTLVVDRAVFPRYKTCGGGLVGATLASLPADVRIPVRQEITRATFTLRGGRSVTKRSRTPILTMVDRADFDHALLLRAVRAGAAARLGTTVVALQDEPGDDGEHGDGLVRLVTRQGVICAKYVVGADGSASRVARQVAVTIAEVDLGLELELEAGDLAEQWSGRLTMDWGAAPGSYGWVFPKGERLTLGVIAAKGDPDDERAYLERFVRALGLDRARVLKDSGHLTRCRAPGSPLGRGRVLLAGDAAGLLDPWTREGISFAVRSGLVAGRLAAAAARDPTRAPGHTQETYQRWVDVALTPEMRAGRTLLSAFERRPDVVHAMLTHTPLGWSAFRRMCLGETSLPGVLATPVIGAGARILAGGR